MDGAGDDGESAAADSEVKIGSVATVGVDGGSVAGSRATQGSQASGGKSKAGSGSGSGSALVGEEEGEDGDIEGNISDGGPAPDSTRSSAYSSTTLSTETSASSVALSSRDIYDRVAWSRPGTGRSGSSSSSGSSYYSNSAYSDGSQTARSGASSRFSFGTPRTSADYEDDEEFEKQYRRRYSTESGESDYSQTSWSYTAYSGASSGDERPRLFRAKRAGAAGAPSSDDSGTYTSRSGSSMTDFSASSSPSYGDSRDYSSRGTSSQSSRPSTGDSYDYDEDSRSGYSDTPRSMSGRSEGSSSSYQTTPRTPSLSQASADFTESMPSTARSEGGGDDDHGSVGAHRSTEENIRLARIQASGGGYGKGTKRPDHRKMAQRDKRLLRSGATSGLSLSSRMVSSLAAASEDLIQQGYEKDKRASRNLPPLEHDYSMEHTRLAPTKEELDILPVPSSDVAVRVPVARDRARADAVVGGVSDTFIATEQSDLAREIKEKEDEMARMLSLSNPNSRGGSRPGTKDAKGRPRSQGKSK